MSKGIRPKLAKRIRERTNWKAEACLANNEHAAAERFLQEARNDLAAANEHRRRDADEIEKLRQALQLRISMHEIGVATIKQLTEERDDWRFAFKTICKLVAPLADKR